jgi:hypothetical protein
LAGGPPAEQLLGGLFDCLPVPCRTEFSFSTGLKFSSRRPFRLVVLSGDREEQRRVGRLYNLRVLDLSAARPAAAPEGVWARAIERVLKHGRGPLLAERLEQWTDVGMEDLTGLGLELFEELDDRSSETETAEGETVGGERPDSCPPSADQRLVDDDSLASESDNGPADRNVCSSASAADEIRQAHAAHAFFQKELPAAIAAAHMAGPSAQLDAHNPAVQEALERLDDLVFDAVAGRTASLDQLKALWAEVERDVDSQLLAESREQYLRYALSLWEQGGQRDGEPDMARAVQSLEVLCVLFAGA